VGTLTLNASIGGSKIKIWKETAMQNQVALPKTYNLSSDSIDGTLYVDGTDTGEVMLDLHYKDPSGAEIQRDKVKLLITPTVSYSPRGWFVYAWEPALYHLSKEGLEALEEEVGDSGWTVVCYEDSAVDDDCEDCTLLAFESMKYGGVVAPHSHSAVSGFCAVFYNTSVSCNEWRDGEDHMTTVRWGEEQKWYVKAEPEWFNDNWADKLDANRAIVVWMCCHAAEGGQDSIVQQAGGRTAFAYVGTTDSGKHAHNMERLFGQLNGTLYAGTNRTAGKAYAGGAGYQGNFTMVGSNWTTLHPAPYDVFPNAPTNGKEGYGCIIFDTYMKDTVSANQAVVKDSGGGTVGPRYWFGHAGGNWSIGYYFDTTTGAITMRAEADNCENETSDGVQTRYMAGDRQTYRADKNWTF